MVWEGFLKVLPIIKIHATHGSRFLLYLGEEDIIRYAVFIHHLLLDLLSSLRLEMGVWNSVLLHVRIDDFLLDFLVLEDVVDAVSFLNGLTDLRFHLWVLTGIHITCLLLIGGVLPPPHLDIGCMNITITVSLGHGLTDFFLGGLILTGVIVTCLLLIVLQHVLCIGGSTGPRCSVTIPFIKGFIHFRLDLWVLTGIIIPCLFLIRLALLFVLPFQCDIIIIIRTAMFIT